MQFLRGSGGGVAGVGGGAGAVGRLFVRYFSKKRSPDLRRINPKVPKEEAKTISAGLYQIVKDQGPLSVGNAWNQVKDAGIDGLKSKTHMKIMLKWMTGRKMLKLSCTQVGSAKKFHYSSLPEEVRPLGEVNSPTTVSEIPKTSGRGTKKSQNPSKKR